MTAKKAATQKYIIVKPGVCLKGIEETPVGKKVSLTDEKAQAMIGKVRLLEDYEAENKSDADLTGQVEQLTKDNKELIDQVEKSIDVADESTKKIDELTGQVKQLTKDSTKIIKDLKSQVKNLTALLPPDGK